MEGIHFFNVFIRTLNRCLTSRIISDELGVEWIDSFLLTDLKQNHST
jgi:hypothetical protein